MASRTFVPTPPLTPNPRPNPFHDPIPYPPTQVLPPGETMLLGCLATAKLGVHLGVEEGGLSDTIWLQDLTFQVLP